MVEQVQLVMVLESVFTLCVYKSKSYATFRISHTTVEGWSQQGYRLKLNQNIEILVMKYT